MLFKNELDNEGVEMLLSSSILAEYNHELVPGVALRIFNSKYFITSNKWIVIELDRLNKNNITSVSVCTHPDIFTKNFNVSVNKHSLNEYLISLIRFL